MASDQVTDSRIVRASEPARKQRDGSAFVGGYGTKTGDSDLLFLEGQLPKRDGTIARTDTPAEQLEHCLRNLEPADILQLTLYLADMDAYERVNETYEQFFDESYPARTTVGVCEPLGGAAVTVDAVVAVE